MPRRAKLKKVCCLPKCNKFSAFETNEGHSIIISIEEYEAIRLMDYQGFTQEESAEKMKIARTTFQYLYEQAKNHIAKAIVEGKNLIIKGGTYQLCDGKEKYCSCGGCEKHRNAMKENYNNIKDE